MTVQGRLPKEATMNSIGAVAEAHFRIAENLTLVRSKGHHNTKIVSSGDGRSFYVAVPYLGKFSRKYESATFYKSAYYKSASLGRFSR